MCRKFRADIIAFFVCLTDSIGLAVGGFYAPPMGVIDGSVITTIGLLLGFATLAVSAQAIKDGRLAQLRKGDLSVTIGQEAEQDHGRGRWREGEEEPIIEHEPFNGNEYATNS